jgi:hypothetical protein
LPTYSHCFFVDSKTHLVCSGIRDAENLESARCGLLRLFIRDAASRLAKVTSYPILPIGECLILSIRETLTIAYQLVLTTNFSFKKYCVYIWDKLRQ